MHGSTIELCDFTPAHLPGALALSQGEGWPHRLEDWELVLSLGRGAVAVARGRVVGTVVMVPFGEDTAAINMVIVDPSARGRGLGRKLMVTALELAGTRECRLVATAEGLPLYERLGFRAEGEVHQHQGVPAASPALRDAAIAFDPVPDTVSLAAIDRQATDADRTALLEQLSRQARFARAEGGGFAALRAFGRGTVAGPVIARSGDEARALLTALLAHGAGRFTRVDMPDEAGLGPWLEDRGLAHVGGGIAMRRNARPHRPSSPFRTFALASQAFG